MSSEHEWAGHELKGTAFEWLVTQCMPFWLERAWDGRAGSYFGRLDSRGVPIPGDPTATLVQARMLFVCAHLADVAGDGPWMVGVDRALDGLAKLFDPRTGCHVKAIGRNGGRSAPDADLRIDAYDESFVLLGLGALYRVRPTASILAQIERTWQGMKDTLGEVATGAFHENSDARELARPYPMPRRQNPHMHLFEALLEIFDATGSQQYLSAATGIVELFERFFVDQESGALREFLDRDLGPASGPQGEVREPGHQFEWVWLLQRYGRMAGRDMQDRIEPLYSFGLKGVHRNGVYAGLAVDELEADGSGRSMSMLLWPQTEALKAHLSRAEACASEARARARQLLYAMFRHHIRADPPIWRNQIALDGSTLQADSPTRLLYHLVLAITEARRCGLDAENPVADESGTIRRPT